MNIGRGMEKKKKPQTPIRGLPPRKGRGIALKSQTLSEIPPNPIKKGKSVSPYKLKANSI